MGGLTKIERMRGLRYALLAGCDWTQLPDAPVSPEKKEEWAEYRQALRDITDEFPDGENVVWPTRPQ